MQKSGKCDDCAQFSCKKHRRKTVQKYALLDMPRPGRSR